MKIFITGTAGFIGFHLVDRLLTEGGVNIIGLDVINDYYDVNLKYSRLEEHGIDGKKLKDRELCASTKYFNYRFLKADLADHDFLVDFMVQEKFDVVVNLAAQAGVRYSIENPRAYTHSNIIGFLSILEGCRHSNVKHLVYASSSSVYGLNDNLPFRSSDSTDHPMALYGATKKSNEIMAHSYSHLFELPTTGLRFFTVYGPMGRPDMALFLFAEAIRKNEPINVFGHGKMIRDFTYVDDIVLAISKLLVKPPKKDDKIKGDLLKGNTSSAPYSIYNIGNNSPVNLMEYINAIENALGKEAVKNYLDMQQGDVIATYANVDDLYKYINFKPQTKVQEGINKFIEWYRAYYKY